jgi:hypothetical protein
MSIIKNNTSSPFRLTFQSSRGAQGGAYENVPTTATYGSNEAIVEAIAGIGKVAGGLVAQKMAKKDAAKVDKEAKINKLEKEQNEKIQRKISNNSGDLEQDVKSGLTTSQDDFGLAKIPQPSLSNREKKARGISFE